MPILMPDPWPLASFPNFDIDRSGQRATRTRAGAPMVVDLSEPLWTMSMSSYQLEPSEALRLMAWFDQLEGALFPFWGYDLRRKWPGAYPNGSWPTDIGGSGSSFNGNCALADVSDDGLTIDLEDLPAHFQFLAGDYVQISLGVGNRALHRLSIDESANGDGEATITVQPRVRAGWEAGDVVDLKKPSTQMHMLPDSYSASHDGRFSSISFSAIQVLE